jgi:hypothetical protein
MEYGLAFAVGLQLAFALAMVVLVGRWITAEEFWIGVLLRGGLLTTIAALTFQRFGTVWYWLMLPLAALPLADWWCGISVTGVWMKARRSQKLSRAMAAAAEQPKSALLRLHLALALLETGQTEAGLAAMEEALPLAPPDSTQLLSEMAAEGRREFVRYCPSCKYANPSGAPACRCCLGALREGVALRLLLRVCRPLLRLLVRRARLTQAAIPR